MSRSKKGKYLTPSLGNVYFQDDIVQRPSQGGGIITRSTDVMSLEATDNPIESFDTQSNIIPDIANEQITDVVPIPETDNSAAE